MEKLFSVKSASEFTSMSQGFFRKAIASKEISIVKIGTAVRIKESALLNFMKSKGFE